jgi:hypothetical protein
MSGPLQRSPVSPWAGLFSGMIGWAVHHQLGSDLVFADCRNGGPLLTGGLGLACALAVAAGAALSWSARAPAGGEGRSETRRFAVAISLGAAALFLLAIAFQTLSGFIVPACHR